MERLGLSDLTLLSLRLLEWVEMALVVNCIIQSSVREEGPE